MIEKVLDGRDVEFGRRLAAAGLLLPSLDARTEAPAAGRQGDLWGGPSAAPGPSRWAVGPRAGGEEGALYDNRRPKPAQWCDEQPKIEAEWAAQAAARAAAGR